MVDDIVEIFVPYDECTIFALEMQVRDGEEGATGEHTMNAPH